MFGYEFGKLMQVACSEVVLFQYVFWYGIDLSMNAMDLMTC